MRKTIFFLMMILLLATPTHAYFTKSGSFTFDETVECGTCTERVINNCPSSYVGSCIACPQKFQSGTGFGGTTFFGDRNYKNFLAKGALQDDNNPAWGLSNSYISGSGSSSSYSYCGACTKYSNGYYVDDGSAHSRITAVWDGSSNMLRRIQGVTFLADYSWNWKRNSACYGCWVERCDNPQTVSQTLYLEQAKYTARNSISLSRPPDNQPASNSDKGTLTFSGLKREDVSDGVLQMGGAVHGVTTCDYVAKSNYQSLCEIDIVGLKNVRITNVVLYPMLSITVRNAAGQPIPAYIKIYDQNGDLSEHGFMADGHMESVIYATDQDVNVGIVAYNEEGGAVVKKVFVPKNTDILQVDVPSVPAEGGLLTVAAADARYLRKDLEEVESRHIVAGSVTAAQLAANSISSGNIVDGQVTSADVKDGTITSADVRDAALASSDFAASTFALFNHNHNAVYSLAVHDHGERYEKKLADVSSRAPSRVVPGKAFYVTSTVRAEVAGIGAMTPTIGVPAGFAKEDVLIAPVALNNPGDSGKGIWKLTAPVGNACYSVTIKWTNAAGKESWDAVAVMVDGGV